MKTIIRTKISGRLEFSKNWNEICIEECIDVTKKRIDDMLDDLKTDIILSTQNSIVENKEEKIDLNYIKSKVEMNSVKMPKLKEKKKFDVNLIKKNVVRKG